MIISADELPADAVLSAHVAVVGAGPAGISTALELAGGGFDVLLIESGFTEFDGGVQQLSEAAEWDRERHTPMSLAVRRQLGGTSVVWGGRCVPYDAVDFDHRPYISDVPWPVTYEDLSRYFQRACDWLQCGRAVFDVTQMRHLPPALVPDLPDGKVSTATFERWSLPTDFAREYGDALKRSQRIRVLTGLTCTQVNVQAGKNQASDLSCRALDGKRVSIRARAYVLAAGGLETTRLMLTSPGAHGAPVGDHAGHLGRWYMGHVLGSIATVRLNALPRATVLDYERDIDGTYVRRRFSISRETQLERSLPNVVAWLANPNPADARHRNGALSLTYLALRSPLGKHITSESRRLSLTGVNIPQSAYHYTVSTPISSHLLNVARDCPSITRLAVELSARYFPPRGRGAPSFFARSGENRYPLQYHGEQVPNRQSRVHLAADRDAVGMPKLRIDMEFSEQDVNGVLRYHEIWDAHLRLHNCGRLEYVTDDPRAAVWRQLGGGGHQLGTTRMAASDRDGVVDAQLAVHGMSNLFVVSSSAFLTSSQANPTFMIVVFGLRLADRLKLLLPGL